MKNMKKMYAPRLDEYEESSYFDEKKFLEAMKKINGRRKPTSVALEEELIKELKKLAKKNNVPYQVLMRMFILDGVKKMKKAS
ncbi:MAG: CopG family antitoxin [Halobacteriovoraceae bacterium]|nr:CopG family antitoxin [Halobacteriovoraceae bacterium]